MKLIVLLVAIFVTVYSQTTSTVDDICTGKATNQKDCEAIVSVNSPGAVACQWCLGSFCRPAGLTCDCNQCAFIPKPSATCPDGSAQNFKCDITTCSWVADTCTATCSQCPLPKPTATCPDGSAQNFECSLTTCKWAEVPCPVACKDCPLPMPTATCPDGTAQTFSCDFTTCKWGEVPCATVACKECPAPMPTATCSDGTAQTFSCDFTTCKWAGKPCPGTTCCPEPSPDPAPCANNIAPPVACEPTSCQWIIADCPAPCQCPDPIPDPTVCPNGVLAKPQCVDCAWMTPTCSDCPPGVLTVNCLIDPCKSVELSPYFNKEQVATCKSPYCGDCIARCYDTAGLEVKCIVDATVTVCSATSCPADMPALPADCVDGKQVCSRSTVDPNACVWTPYCPQKFTTCTADSCGINDLTTAIKCAYGEPIWTCEQISVGTTDPTMSTAVKQCAWTSKCPLPIDNTVQCIVGGPCGDQCVEQNSTVALTLKPIDATVCRTDVTCEEKCSIAYRLDGSCKYTTTGCSFVYQTGYYECLKQCSSGVVEPPVCSGNVCACDYSNCFSCLIELQLITGRKIAKSVCASSKYGDACAVFGGKSVFTKPDNCDIANQITDGKSTLPPEIAELINSIKTKVDFEKIQAAINDIISKIQELKDFIISAQLTTDPQVNTDKQVTLDIVLSITGPRNPTTIELEVICEKLVKPALRQASGVPTEFRCSLEKVTGSVKRAISATSSNTYAANVVSTSGSSAVVLSFFVAVLALLALTVF